MIELKHNNDQSRLAFSSIFLRSTFSLLFLGLTYRFFFSSNPLQLPPIFLPNPKPGFTQASHNVSSKCNLFMGEWIPDPDAPTYNSTCNFIDEPQNCVRNGRPDLDYNYWRWKPLDCHLPKLDPIKFLNTMRGKSLAFVGDSIMRNHAGSLLCILSQVEEAVDMYHDEQYKNRRWAFPSYDFNISLFWSPFLTKALMFEDDNGISSHLLRLNLDEPDATWTHQFKDHDYMVIAGGKWYLKSALYYENDTLVGCHNCRNPNITELGFVYAYRKALNTTLKFIVSSEHKTYTVFRSLAPDHFENGGWDTGGYCNRTVPFRAGEIKINYVDEVMRKAELDEWKRAAEIASEKEMRLRLFDVTYMSLLRPDGHPGAYRAAGNGKVDINDCLHWCLPGPIDSWNDLVVEILMSEGD